AARGFDLVARVRTARRALLRPLGLLVGLGTALGAALLLLGHSRATTVAARDAGRQALVAGSALAVVWPWPRLGRTRGVLAPGALGALDLAIAGRPIVGTVPVASVAGPPPFMGPLLGSQRDEVLFHQAAWELAARGSTMNAAQPPIPAQWGVALTLEEDF